MLAAPGPKTVYLGGIDPLIADVSDDGDGASAPGPCVAGL